MSERETIVELVGGPADWRGRRVAMPVPQDPAEAGAYLISADTPDRSEDTDTDPRAVYAPDPGGPADVWHFRGWFPAAADDPDPQDYLRSEEPLG